MRIAETRNFNREKKIASGTILLSDSLEIKGRDIHVGNDSTSFVNEDNNELDRLANTSIRSIETKDHAVGAMEGLGIGVLGGGGLGFGLVWMIHQQDDYGRTFYGLLGGMAGGTIGLVVGLAKGHTDRYEFSQGALPDSASAHKNGNHR
jgi:hypothetical protein